jgi:hypothetical protein
MAMLYNSALEKHYYYRYLLLYLYCTRLSFCYMAGVSRTLPSGKRIILYDLCPHPLEYGRLVLSLIGIVAKDSDFSTQSMLSQYPLNYVVLEI